MTDKILCKYYLHGACKFGRDCRFSHDTSHDAPSMVCKYYLQGQCAYGDSCRYDHVRPSWAPPKHAATPCSAYAAPPITKPPVDPLEDQIPLSRLRLGNSGASQAGGGMPLPVPLPLDGQAPRAAQQAQQQQQAQQGAAGNEDDGWDEEGEYEEFYEDGVYDEGCCEEVGGEFYGEQEEYDAGDAYYYEEGEEGEEQQWEEDWAPQQQHQQQSQEGPVAAAAAAAGGAGAWEQGGAWQHAAAGEADEEEEGDWRAGGAGTLAVPLKERSLCMQYLLGGSCSKGAACNLIHGELCEHCHRYALHPHDAAARAAHTRECQLRHERLAARARSSHVECCICLEAVLQKADARERKFGLMACDHAFCLGCIRSWRQKVDGPADVDSALRTCPVCRTTTHFITPSTTWPDSSEEKELIISGYKAKLGTIDCKHFALGEGTCPFGTSCFYRHAYRDGRLEEPSLRKAAVDEGEVKVLQPVRLSDFLSASSVGQQLLGGSRSRR